METINVGIVEDNELMREMLASALEEGPFNIVGEAATARDGIEMIIATQPHIVLLDLILPGEDGFYVMEELKRRQIECKFLVLSSLGEDAFVRKALEEGASYYMIKPFDAKILRERINNIVSYESNGERIYDAEEYARRKLRDEVYDEITRLMLRLGISVHLDGARFLREAVMKAIEDPESINSTVKCIYPAVAEVCASSPRNVERSIRHAIDVAWTRGRMEDLNGILSLNFYTHTEKPTNSEIIALISEKIRSDSPVRDKMLNHKL